MQSHRAAQLNLLALAARIEPSPVELANARMHKVSVRGRLAKSFDIASIREIGSQARGTAIRTHSDLDLMVVLRKDELLWGGAPKSSETVVRYFLGELRTRFPNSGIRKDGLAATIDFGSTGQSLDVVPAVFRRFDRSNSRPVFLIPDGSGGWFETSPQVHDAYFEMAVARSGSKLRKVSQLIKWWKYSRATPLPLGSFYTDMVLASQGICSGVKSYGQCLHDFFALMARGRCGYLEDPCSIAGKIPATNTEPQRQQLLAAVQGSLFHAAQALSAQRSGDVPESNRQWNIVFNGGF